MLAISTPELLALAAGETVVAFVERGTAYEGDEVELVDAGPLPEDAVKPAYRRWAAAAAPEGEWSAVVESVDPASVLDPGAGSARHVLAVPGAGDLVVLRVYRDGEPVLSDAAFEARRRHIEGALKP